MLAGSLSSEIVDSLHSYQPEEETVYRRLYKKKYIFGHRVDINLFSNLTLGLNEVIIAGDRSPDFIYFVPTASVWDAQHYFHDPDNVMMALDVNWSPGLGPRLYGSIAIDEYRLETTFSDSLARNWIAVQLGGAWTLPIHDGRWHLWVEATRIMPHVYQHKFPVNDWTHSNSWLGFWSGQNSEVIEGSLTFLVSPRFSLGIWGRNARKGGKVSRLVQYQTPPSEKFLFGGVRYGAWVGGRLTYEGKQHWRIVTEIVRAPERLWPHESPPASLGQEWQFAVRWNYNPF